MDPFAHIKASLLRREDGSWARSDEDKVDIFTSYSESTFSPKSPKHIIDINNLLLEKSPGPDLRTANILSHLSHKALMIFTLIFNNALRATPFPSQ